MNSLFRANKWRVAMGGLVVVGTIVACAQYENTTASERNVVMSESGILLQQPVAMSKENEAAMDKVLKKYDKSLYKIEIVENGTVTQTKGQLETAGVAQVAAAATKSREGRTHRTVQVAICPSPCKEARMPNRAAAERLVGELTPILKAYQ